MTVTHFLFREFLCVEIETFVVSKDGRMKEKKVLVAELLRAKEVWLQHVWDQ